MMPFNFTEALQQHNISTAPVVPLQQHDKIIPLDFTHNNQQLTDVILNNTTLFSHYINQKLQEAGATYGIGGYNEHRTIYKRSHVFDGSEEPRRLHLGTDIWGPAGTPVYAPLEGTVHSFAFNGAYGDYGATIILQHTLNSLVFYTLYGHLNAASLHPLTTGMAITKGQCIAAFGVPEENGFWPPHLHFQIIINMEGNKGDYPGVCPYSQREKYLANCPDPDVLLQLNHLVK